MGKKGAGKRKTPSPPKAETSGGKRQKQVGIVEAIAGRPAAPTVQLEAPLTPRPPTLDTRVKHDILHKADKYMGRWGDKCTLLGAAQERGAPSSTTKQKEEMDLDGPGFSLLDWIQRSLQHAPGSGGGALDPALLEVLALVCRNDSVHSSSEVSWQAYSLLCRHLEEHPYARMVALEEEGPYAGRPVLLHNEEAAWFPLPSAASAFTARYLLYPEMADGGRQFKTDHPTGGRQQHHQAGLRGQPDKYLTTFFLLRSAYQAAYESGEVDRNGDLMLLRYLLSVLRQDLRCRLEVYSAWAGCEEALQGRRHALLNGSLLWRVWTDLAVDRQDKLRMVQLLVRLITCAGDERQLQEVDEEEEEEEEELLRPRDQDLASACMFTRREQAAMAAEFLNMLLELFGVAEDAGLFHSMSRSRDKVKENLRMQLDGLLQTCFWGSASVCRNDDQSRAFLNAMAPRDRLRFLGLLAADKFTNTWENENDKKKLPGLLDAHHLLTYGSDARSFVDVDAVEVVKSINIELPRAIKAYTNINLVTVMLASLALGVHAMLAAGGSDNLACLHAGAAGLPALRQELQTALRGIAEQSREPLTSHQLSRSSMFDLIHAQMALAGLAA